MTGLILNVIGVVFFAEHHVHLTAGGQCAAHGCTDAEHGAHSANMSAVLLHVAADALGSIAIGVIISSLLIRTLGWTLVVWQAATRAFHARPAKPASTRMTDAQIAHQPLHRRSAASSDLF
mmetsp:Transcript_24173/g.62283  ORF Transcript_24173/g.62283 Transcript_24173/m.62283 type:complete len:121 (+) Transcript_24173:44-406(+)